MRTRCGVKFILTCVMSETWRARVREHVESVSDEPPEDVSLSQGKEEALKMRRVAAIEAKR